MRVKHLKHEERKLEEGTLTFTHLDEGEYRQLTFNPPLVVNWSLWLCYDEEGPRKGYDVYVKTMFVDYDFGLTDRFNPYRSMQGGWHYNDIDENTPVADIAKAFVEYDLCHAFFHVEFDPNYSHLHWALRGWLENRATIKDKE